MSLAIPVGKDDHVLGPADAPVTLVEYGDYQCPACGAAHPMVKIILKRLGAKLRFVFRNMPLSEIHPNAELAAEAAEAAAAQGKFWEMHDALFERSPSLTEAIALELAGKLGLDLPRFRRDLDDPKLRKRIDDDLAEGRRNGVTATPTIFVDGVRYDGAWDFYSMLEALERPVGARVQRTARAFANLPTSAGLVLLLAAAAALALANSPAGGMYAQFVGAQVAIGPVGGAMSLSISEWASEGLLAIFFLIIGLEIRREMSAGSLSDPKAAAAPVIAALGGILAPAGIYLALNHGPTAAGWSAPSDTGIAFTLGILAVFGARASASLKVFVAAYAVADDVFAILILAIFYPHNLHAEWLIASAAAVALMFTLNRWRVYVGWPYLAATVALWTSLHLAGIEGALSGVVLAAFLPTRPTPSASPLLAQAASALAELEQAEHALRRAGADKRRVEQEPIWGWASRNLSAAAARLLSPAERVERSLAPWSTYVVLPLFAFTAAGVPLSANLGEPRADRVLWGVVIGLAIGKPLGIIAATWAAVKARIAIGPADASRIAFFGAACLCGIGDPLSILMAEQAFTGTSYAAVAKLGVLLGSACAALFGAAALSFSPPPATAVKPQAPGKALAAEV